MDNYVLPVEFDGREYNFPARLIDQGFIRKFDVLVNGRSVVFEPDEEGKFRAVDTSTNEGDRENIPLLAEIAAVIQFIVD